MSEAYRLNSADYHSRYYGGAGYQTNEIISLGAADGYLAALVVGDSFGLQYAKSYDEIAKASGFKLEALFDHGCMILPTFVRYIGEVEDASCSAEYEKVVSMLDAQPSIPLVLANSWATYGGVIGIRGSRETTRFSSHQNYLDEIISDLEKLIQRGGTERMYYLIGMQQRTSIPAFRCLSQTELLGSRLLQQCNDREPSRPDVTNDALKMFAESRSNVTYLDPNEVLCASGACLVIKDRKPIHSDGSHLSVYGAMEVAPYILRRASVLPSGVSLF